MPSYETIEMLVEKCLGASQLSVRCVLQPLKVNRPKPPSARFSGSKVQFVSYPRRTRARSATNSFRGSCKSLAPRIVKNGGEGVSPLFGAFPLRHPVCAPSRWPFLGDRFCPLTARFRNGHADPPHPLGCFEIVSVDSDSTGLSIPPQPHRNAA